MAGWGEANGVRKVEKPGAEILELFQREQRTQGSEGNECSLVDFRVLVAEFGRVPVILYEVRHLGVTEGMVMVEARVAVGDGGSNVVHTTWEATTE